LGPLENLPTTWRTFASSPYLSYIALRRTQYLQTALGYSVSNALTTWVGEQDGPAASRHFRRRLPQLPLPKNGKYAYDVVDNTDPTALGLTAPLGRMNQ
jgi:hypothetical protein